MSDEHLGTQDTLNILKQTYLWRGMKHCVKDYINHCCQTPDITDGTTSVPAKRLQIFTDYFNQQVMAYSDFEWFCEEKILYSIDHFILLFVSCVILSVVETFALITVHSQHLHTYIKTALVV